MPKRDETERQAYDYELIAMCYHEASHAMCGLLHHMRVFEVSVMRSNEKVGLTHYEMIDTADTKDFSDKKLIKYFAHSEVAISYAGFIGEKIYYYDICGSNRFPMSLKSGSYFDFKDANTLIKKYKLAAPGIERAEYKKKLQSYIHKQLKEYWSDVKLIAHLLYNKRKIFFHDMRNILIRKSINKEFWKKHFKKISQVHRSALKYDEAVLKEFIINS
jgi:hypothetical protein